MRKIFFKAKDIKTGKWIMSYDILKRNNFIEVDSSTVCQYTGIKRLHEYLFTGDIVDLGSIGKGVVVFNHYSYLIKCYNDNQYYDLDYFEAVEVIGNIHDKEANND